jgi:hypothetical protein
MKRPKPKSSARETFDQADERLLSEREWCRVIRNSEPARRADVQGNDDSDGSNELPGGKQR